MKMEIEHHIRLDLEQLACCVRDEELIDHSRRGQDHTWVQCKLPQVLGKDRWACFG